MYSGDPVNQNLYEWEAEYFISRKSKSNVGKTKAQHAAELIRKLQGWESGLEPFTDEILEEVFNADIWGEKLDVADAFQDYGRED
jgi:hypothetical protein